jgi:glycosyltransferase involved in cell wall biosynthesis
MNAITTAEMPLRVAIVTDAWWPQVNGVVRTLTEVRRELMGMGHEVMMVTPQGFKTVSWPNYPEIRLSLAPYRKVARMIEGFEPNALHIATEGPLGSAARKFALRHGLRFTTAYHTRFPEYLQSQIGLPPSVVYWYLRRFHRSSERVMVATPSIRRELAAAGFNNLALWSRGVDVERFSPDRNGPSPFGDAKGPIFLSVGRVSVEKNVSAFLALDLPGTKCVVGKGPALNDLKRRHPEARFLGVVKHEELQRYYAAADVMVFPSRTDTFGLVLLEALACGCPVAAYPACGPVDVIGESGAGAIDEDLRRACLAALHIPRERARAHALTFSWAETARHFARHLRPLHSGQPENAASKAASLKSQPA